MKKKIIISCFLIILVTVILGVTIKKFSNPLRKSEERIREDMLELTPIGMSMGEVVEVIKSNEEWTIDWITYDYGYGLDRAGSPGEDYHVEIGEKSIRIYIGKYNVGIIVPVHVIVYYGFDEDSQLIDIAVRKDMDVL